MAYIGLFLLWVGVFFCVIDVVGLLLAGFTILTSPVSSHSIAAHRNIGRLRYGSRDDLADAREGKLQ